MFSADKYAEHRRNLLVEILGQKLADKLLAAEASDGVLRLSPDEYCDFLDRANPANAPPRIVLGQTTRVEIVRQESDSA